MTALRAVLASGRGRIVLGAHAAYLGWQAWLGLAAPGKVAPELRGKARVNVLVTLPFEPERFHVLAMQRYGRVAGAEATGVELRGVRAEDLDAIARPYWVKRVGPMQE